ncbi:MAG: 30S ribosomal protein S2 [Abitibacteriaceae bacterium]|nr:30S ribosomal protein S2 [Abditibacteriaceae bacterium]MBV9866396.1 30S ribosomal protein S2 [Abditibacteriaceae bacterium]
MPVSSMKELLEAGVHFGHHTRKWNPKMKPYIYGARNDIYIIDLHKTRKKLEEAYEQVRQMAFNGNRFLFVGTKKQAQDSIAEAAVACNMFYVNHRWLGGMLTNWPTIQTRIDRLNQLDKMTEDGTMEKLPKKESARLQEEREKLTAVLGGIRNMNGLPDAIFIVDCKKEHIAINEAHRLDIPLVAVVDTNCDPDEVDHVIPGNDDAIRAVRLMAMQMAEAINEGRGMAQSAQEQAAAATLQGAVGGAVHIGEGGRIEYVGAPAFELPPVDTGEGEGEGSEELLQAFGDGATPSQNGSSAPGAPASNGAQTGEGVPGPAGDTSDPDSATQRSGDTLQANGGDGASVQEVEAGGNAVGPGAPKIHTDENSDEAKSERSNLAQTPAEGTLG